jgi:hypothetical protein
MERLLGYASNLSLKRRDVIDGRFCIAGQFLPTPLQPARARGFASREQPMGGCYSHREIPMKLFIATAALAGVIACPAVAQTYYEQQTYVTPPRLVVQPWAGQAYATPYGPYYGRIRSANPAFDVYQDGRYVGSDPDPRVRSMMANDDAMTGND